MASSMNYNDYVKSDTIRPHRFEEAVREATKKLESKKETNRERMFDLSRADGIGMLNVGSLRIPVKVTNIKYDSSPFSPGDLEIECIALAEDVKTKDGVSSAFDIEKVIYNEPATIVMWSDGTKTVVKCQDGDYYDPEKGLAMCIAKKALGNKGNYNNVFKKFACEEPKTSEPILAFDKETTESINKACESIRNIFRKR